MTAPHLSRPRMRLDRPTVELGLVLMAGWAFISLGNAVRYGSYTPLAIILVAAGMGCLTVGIGLLATGRDQPPGRLTLVAGSVVALASTVLSPAERYAHGTAERWSHGILIAAGTALLALAILNRAGGRAKYLVIAAAGVAGVAGIRATPRPTIDDWHILQGSAKATLHLQNMYSQAWPGAEGHLQPYLPGSAVLLTPFYLVLDDVRYGLLAALLLGAVAVVKVGKTNVLGVLAGLTVIYPWVLYGVEQSWPEPLLLGLLAAMVCAMVRGRPGWALVAFTLALVTKQHVVILLPLAAVWPAFGWRRTIQAVVAAAVLTAPWIIADPSKFWQGAVTYNLNLPPRHDSLSVFTTAIRTGHTPSFALVPLIMLVALGFALWKLPRTAAGFALGSAWLLGVFNFVNKQSFFNEWSLVIGLIVVAMAALTVRAAPVGQPTVSST